MDSDYNHNHLVKPKKKLSDFMPLIMIVGSVVVATYFGVLYTQDASMMNAMRLFMGFFFLVFGAFKAVKLKGFAKAYAEYDVIAMRSRAYGYAYPFIELGLAALFLSGMYLVFANVVTLVIMLVGAYGVYLKLRKREVIPCACLGVVFKIPMTYVTLGEDVLMAAMAAGMLLVLL